MSVVLAATSMLRLDYTVQGLPHKLDMYCAYNDVLGQHQLVDRDGITTVLWTLAGQYIWSKLCAIFSPASVPSPAQLSLLHRTGTLWNVVDISALTGIGGSAGVYAPASQITWTVRDSAFKFIKFEALEGTGEYAGKYKNGIGFAASTNAVSNALSGADTDASAPYRWMKSRGDRFIAATGAIAGMSMRLNDKLARARGV